MQRWRRDLLAVAEIWRSGDLVDERGPLLDACLTAMFAAVDGPPFAWADIAESLAWDGVDVRG